MAIESGVSTPLMKIKASGAWHFGFSSAVKLDNLEAVNGQPMEDAPAPADVNLAVSALVGCTCATMSAVACEMNFRHSGIDFEGKAEFDVDNLTGPGNAVRRFQAVHGTIKVRTDENEDRLNELALEVRKRCRAFDILESAGISTEIEWIKSDPK